MKVNVSPNSGFTSAQVRDIIRAVRPPGISAFDVEIKASRHAYAGAAYPLGCGYHGTAAPLIVARIGPADRYPRLTHYKGRQDGAYPQIIMYDRLEALVVVLAHELRHLWQGKQKNRRGYTPHTRGKYSEVDAEAYALNKLRAWRRQVMAFKGALCKRSVASVK